MEADGSARSTDKLHLTPHTPVGAFTLADSGNLVRSASVAFSPVKPPHGVPLMRFWFTSRPHRANRQQQCQCTGKQTINLS
jgi:hypothetical protein